MTTKTEARGPLAFGGRAHATHRLTRDGADGLDHWHRCMSCGATDAPGDGRLAERCGAPTGAATPLDPRALALGQAGVAHG